MSYHHHCAWGAIHGKTGQPQLGRTCIRATFKIPDTGCPHASHRVHMADLKDGNSEAEIETRGQNQEALAHGLVATLVAAMTRHGGISITLAPPKGATTERPSNLLRRDLTARVRFQDDCREGEPVTGQSSDGILQKRARAPDRSVKTVTPKIDRI